MSLHGIHSTTMQTRIIEHRSILDEAMCRSARGTDGWHNPPWNRIPQTFKRFSSCGGFPAGSLQWEGLKKTGKLPHLARWYDHMGGIPVLQQLAERYYPKRNNAAKKRVADAIKEAKAKEGPAVRHTGKARFQCHFFSPQAVGALPNPRSGNRGMECCP